MAKGKQRSPRTVTTTDFVSIRGLYQDYDQLNKYTEMSTGAIELDSGPISQIPHYRNKHTNSNE